MTTVLADAKAGVMVSDSCVSDGDRVWSGRKVFRVRGHLLGFAGDVAARLRFVDWWKKGAEGEGPSFKGGHCLVMTPGGKLIYYDGDDLPETIESGRESIGTGGVAAIAAYEALNWNDPKRAVAIACHHDAKSRPPVRLYKL